MSAPDFETFFGGSLRSRLSVEEDQAAVLSECAGAEPVLVSPELALVCPELRELALQQLPARAPDGFLPRSAQSAV